jgi:hypothetical protein
MDSAEIAADRPGMSRKMRAGIHPATLLLALTMFIRAFQVW